MSIYAKVKALERRINNRKSHKLINQRAFKALSTIENEKGKLDPKIKKACNEYAVDVLGDRIYAPWLYVYSLVAGEFKKGWIPVNYYSKIVEPRIKQGYGDTSYLKALTGPILRSDRFPDLLYSVNGLWLALDNTLLDDSEVKELIENSGNKIVFKKDFSGRGAGIEMLDAVSTKVSELSKLGNGVIQHYVDQHEQLERLSPVAVATLRITTAVDNEGSVSVRGSYLRLGRINQAHIQSDNQIIVPVDLNGVCMR